MFKWRAGGPVFPFSWPVHICDIPWPIATYGGESRVLRCQWHHHHQWHLHRFCQTYPCLWPHPPFSQTRANGLSPIRCLQTKKASVWEWRAGTIRYICVNDFIAACLVLSHLNCMWVDTAVSILSLARDWSWTLACPAHCGSGSVISFLLAAGLSTILLTSLLLGLFLLYLRPNVVGHPPTTTALAARVTGLVTVARANIAELTSTKPMAFFIHPWLRRARSQWEGRVCFVILPNGRLWYIHAS